MNGNNIRCPTNFIFLFFIGLIFFITFSFSYVVNADVVMSGEKNLNSFSFPEKYNAKEDVQKLNSLISNSEGKYNIIIVATDYYDNNYYKNLKNYSILISDSAINFNGSKYFFNTDSYSFGCNFSISETDQFSNINSFSSSDFTLKTGLGSSYSYSVFPNVVYYNFVNGLNVTNGADTSFFPSPLIEYDKNNLNSYPINTICVTSPVSESDIKTNGRFVNVAIKGKIGIDCTDDIAVTKEDLGKLIRNNFRYSFNSDNESFDNVSYLGPVIETSRGQSPDDDILDILQVLGNEFPIVKGEQIKIAPLNDNWIIGVSGNAKDWTSKKYYNFVINTALYVGENDGDYNYKLNFKVPVGFGMNITYKTITVDYKLFRGSYVDDDFNGIDDNTNEIIPAEEIEIINPSTSTPVLPSDDGLDDGLQVVSILKDIYIDFCNGVNGAANILKSFFSVVNSTVQSVVNYSEEMVISFSNIFGFMPSPVPQLITMSLAIMIFVSVLGFIKK